MDFKHQILDFTVGQQGVCCFTMFLQIIASIWIRESLDMWL